MKKYLLLIVILFAVASANAQFSNTSTYKSKSSSLSDLTFRGEINVGMAFGNTKYDSEKLDGTMVAPVFTGTYGVKLNDYLFLGAGAGIKYMIQEGKETYRDYDYTEEDKLTISSLMLPLYFEIKAFLPVNDAVSPFVMADFGYSVRLSGDFKVDYKIYDDGYYYSGSGKRNTEGGLCYRLGAGIAINDYFTLALGYDCQKFGVKDMDKDFKSSSFFFSLGYTF